MPLFISFVPIRSVLLALQVPLRSIALRSLACLGPNTKTLKTRRRGLNLDATSLPLIMLDFVRFRTSRFPIVLLF